MSGRTQCDGFHLFVGRCAIYSAVVCGQVAAYDTQTQPHVAGMPHVQLLHMPHTQVDPTSAFYVLQTLLSHAQDRDQLEASSGAAVAAEGQDRLQVHSSIMSYIYL